MKYFIAFLLLSSIVHAQSISTLEFVGVIDGHRNEAKFYFENNWKFLRIEAIKKGYIDSYELLISDSEDREIFDILLMTTYRDQKQYKNREKHFAEIMKENEERGLKLLNKLKPKEFRQSLFAKTAYIY